MTALEQLKLYTDGKKNTDKVEISVWALNRIINALSQEPIDCANAEHHAEGCLGYSTDRGGYSYCQTCEECPKASINNRDKEQEPCDDCIFEEGSKYCIEHCPHEAKANKPCDDAISQNQSNACSILDDECPYPHKQCWECPLNYQYELAKHELDKNVELPSVTQKYGEWKVTPMSKIAYCSICDELIKDVPASIVTQFEFCTHCGAKMEREDKE